MKVQRIGAKVLVPALLQDLVRRRMPEFVSGSGNKTGESVRSGPVEAELNSEEALGWS